MTLVRKSQFASQFVKTRQKCSNYGTGKFNDFNTLPPAALVHLEGLGSPVWTVKAGCLNAGGKSRAASSFFALKSH